MDNEVVPFPFVGRQAIVRAYDPLSRGSVRARFHTLRAAGMVSAGIRMPRRRVHGRVRGTLHLYSELNREAVRLYRRGDLQGARLAVEQASALEARTDFVELVEWLAMSELLLGAESLVLWPDVQHLLLDTNVTNLIRSASLALLEVLDQYRQLSPSMQTIRGVVASMQEDTAFIDALWSAFVVPSELLTPLGLDRVGAAVELQVEMLEAGASVVSTAAAIPLNVPLSPYAYVGPVQLSEERWARLRELAASGRSVAPPPLPIPLPSR